MITREHDYNVLGPRTRAALVVPSLLFGGAERWSLALARYCDHSMISWTGCVVVNIPSVERLMLNTMSALMPVYWNGRIWDRGAHSVANLKEASAILLGPADVIFAWEVDEALRNVLDHIDRPVVNVAHRNDPRSLGPFVKDSDNLATVWRSNKIAFGPEHEMRVTVIPNGIDLNRCCPIVDRTVMRSIWGCGDTDLVLGYIGRLHPQKNCIAIARALQALPGTAIAVMYGSRCPETDNIQCAMKALAGRRVRLYPPVEDIGSILAAVDVFVFPSPAEVFSLSLLEAWAAGRPVVAARVGAVPDLEAHHGPLVVQINPEADEVELADAIRYAVSGAPEVTAMRDRAAALVRSQYGVLRMTQSWTDYLSSVRLQIK